MAGKSTGDFPIQDIIEWDVLNWSQLIQYWLPLLEQLPVDSKVLAIGERNGGLSLWLALMGFDVVCTDITDIHSSAHQLHGKYNVAAKIQYKQFDVVNDDWGIQQFDIIIAKSVIGGLKSTRGKSSTRSVEAQHKAMHNIHRLLKPGGYFFSAENLRGGVFTRLARKMRKRKKGWQHPTYHELLQLFSSFTLVQTKTFGILPTLFSPKAVNRLMYGMNRYVLCLLPKGSKYIAFTIAQK